MTQLNTKEKILRILSAVGTDQIVIRDVADIFDVDMTELERLRKVVHAREIHPDYDYETRDGPRKAWDGCYEEMEAAGWTLNKDRGYGAHSGWERFEYHEETYWMWQIKEQ